MAEAEPSPEEAFWRFSLAFYELPGVAPALLALQDRDSLDVNLMLFALWLGITGRGGVGADVLAEADRTTATVRREVVEPLRWLRRRLRQYLAADIQKLREGVKTLELEGEKLVQMRLARLARPARKGVSREDRLAAADANLALYLGPESASSTEAAVILGALGSLAGTEAGDH
jgi:uncharacterized protein (TIGR02444 family)